MNAKRFCVFFINMEKFVEVEPLSQTIKAKDLLLFSKIWLLTILLLLSFILLTHFLMSSKS